MCTLNNCRTCSSAGVKAPIFLFSAYKSSQKIIDKVQNWLLAGTWLLEADRVLHLLTVVGVQTASYDQCVARISVTLQSCG